MSVHPVTRAPQTWDGQRPLISLLHPTARVKRSKAFPRGWRDACEAWWRACDHPENVEYILAVHESRWDEYWDEDARWDEVFPLFGQRLIVQNTLRDCVVDQTNRAALASTGQLLCGVADDYYPPDHWDTLLLEAIADLSKPYHLLCSSGASPERDRELMIAGAITRPIYERRGYLLDPDFESMFADNWLAWLTRKEAQEGLLEIIERLDIQFDHRHPIFGKGEMDEVYALQNRETAYRTGASLFHQKVTSSRVMVMCFPGEQFRSELVGSRFQLIDDVKAHTKYGIVAPHWCYTSNVYATRIELAKAALDFPSCTKDHDLVLFADDDNPVGFPEVAQLMEDLDAHPELGGVVGWCWCDHPENQDSEMRKWVMSCGRQDVTNLTCLRFTPEDFDRAIERGSWLISSDDVKPHAFWSGLPVMLIRRPVLERMGWRAFVGRAADSVLVSALNAAEFASDEYTRKLIRHALDWAEVLDSTAIGMTSEDTSFFLRAHELGITFAVDIRVRVPHMKWRGITPQYVPESERLKAMKTQGEFQSASAAD
jgi:hypothetical protein